MKLTDVIVNAVVEISKTKTNKMVFTTEDLVSIKVLRQEKRLQQLMNNRTASLEITVNVHEFALSRKLVFWTTD